MSQSPQHTETPKPPRIRSYVAVGDSFTEGLDDAYPAGTPQAGTYRGWADLVAARLAAMNAGTVSPGANSPGADDPGATKPAAATAGASAPGTTNLGATSPRTTTPAPIGGDESAADDPEPFRYANLAVRGKLIGQILRDQVPAAATMGADLVTLAGGLNDVMRPGCDIDAVCADLARCADTLAAQSGTVVMFRSMDFSRRMKSSARLVPKVARLMTVVDEMVGQYGVIKVDLASAMVFDDPRLWAVDRIHLSAEGHRRVAEAVLEALGHPATFDWRAPLPARDEPGLIARTSGDVVWLATFLTPWVKRRLTGKSSGDGILAKRPDLAPLD